MYYTILYYTILYYTIHTIHTILYFTIFYCTLPYFTILHYTSLFFTILHYSSLYYTIDQVRRAARLQLGARQLGRGWTGGRAGADDTVHFLLGVDGGL